MANVLISFKIYFITFLLGDSPASELYIPTFRYTVFHLDMWCELSMTKEQTRCAETLAYVIRTLGNNLKERIKHSERGEN